MNDRAVTPCCGNCIAARKHPQMLGFIVCGALPPVPALVGDETGQPSQTNLRPVMNAKDVGCLAMFRPVANPEVGSILTD